MFRCVQRGAEPQPGATELRHYSLWMTDSNPSGRADARYKTTLNPSMLLTREAPAADRSPVHRDALTKLAFTGFTANVQQRPSTRFGRELRVKRDPSEDVYLHSAGSAVVEELHLQKETNANKILEIVLKLSESECKFQLLTEIVWPLFIFFILISVRLYYPPYEQHECHFPNKAMPSAGTLPWIQGIVCNANNPCFRHSTPGESPGVVGNFNDSMNFSTGTKGFRLKDFLHENETLSVFLQQNASFSQSYVNSILEADVNLEKVLIKGFGVHLRDMCSSITLKDFVTISDEMVARFTQEKICSSPSSWLDQAESHFKSNLDFLKPIRSDLRANATDVREVAKATNNLLESLGSLAVELASMRSWSDLRNEILFLSENATGSPGLMYQAVSRIVCGHPEGGGLKIKSLNWYEDSNFQAMFNSHNDSDDQPVSAYDNTTSTLNIKTYV
ncbi:hypothetical protein DNTS_031575 [Danionella cerebrum]|uniref:ATP-binding cassette sub-family A member 1 n=1 Tax=Danionella cerebrum TaxID=2873325 RepID=A0A553QJE6_9TELE|nr:hypothetical protein DNTS_031575 [Danionella translucida]